MLMNVYKYFLKICCYDFETTFSSIDNKQVIINVHKNLEIHYNNFGLWDKCYLQIRVTKNSTLPNVDLCN